MAEVIPMARKPKKARELRGAREIKQPTPAVKDPKGRKNEKANENQEVQEETGELASAAGDQGEEEKNGEASVNSNLSCYYLALTVNKLLLQLLLTLGIASFS